MIDWDEPIGSKEFPVKAIDWAKVPPGVLVTCSGHHRPEFTTTFLIYNNYSRDDNKFVVIRPWSGYAENMEHCRIADGVPIPSEWIKGTYENARTN